MDFPAFGIYVHWPFCESKCPYCDFNSHVAEAVDHATWREAYARELRFFREMTGPRSVTSVFFGGGTPSLMEPETVGFILREISTLWGLSEDCEITMEANPSSVEASRFSAYRQEGVNRVSVGVQSLRDEDLKFLGRPHCVADALKALETAGRVFPRWSLDMIYGRPSQSLKDWEKELGEGLALASGGHVSLYQLTIERGTAFYGLHKRGAFTMPDGETEADFYELTQDMTEAAGLNRYEVSNHARCGEECRHNLLYWRYGDYLGIGPGAHGRLTLEDGEKIATHTFRNPEIWMKKVAETGSGAQPFEPLAREDRGREALLMGLRLEEGVPFSHLEKEWGHPWQEKMDAKKLEAFCKEGLLERDSRRLRATKQGVQILNALTSNLVL